MDSTSFRRKMRPAETLALVQAAILGFLGGEIWFLAQSIGSTVSEHIRGSGLLAESLVACSTAALVGAAYFYFRDGCAKLASLWASYRFDLLSAVVLGIAISASVGGVGSKKYIEYAQRVPPSLLLLLLAAPVVIGLLLILRGGFASARQSDSSSFFINDHALTSAKDDLLGFSESATRFAERVFNGGSSGSLVFGVDAPWGVGKSSFVNLCCEYWDKEFPSRTIVYRFEPLRYAEDADLTDVFVRDLIATIQKHVFAPAIQPLFSKYSRLLKGKSDLSVLGMSFSWSPKSDSVEDVLRNLEDLLLDLDRKIIIVVDDLDRLSWSAIKNVLFAVKRSFMLPNVAYVICYDTENVVANGDNADSEKTREFLEKFINVKISLFLDSGALARYVSENLEHAIKNNLQIDPRTLDKIKEAIEELVVIYHSDEFFRYQDVLGDVRKLKRLINTLMLFEIEKTDFENSDFNKTDLLHLLLLYVHYPSVFRKIYSTEANGKRGFFSLSVSYTGSGSSNAQFVNSALYLDYVKSAAPSAAFLLGKVFDASQLVPKGNVDSVTETERRSRACFNDSRATRNLERYLNLIVKLSKQEKREGYRFYVNKKDEFTRGAPLEDILARDEFSFSKGDFSRDQFWRVIVNSAEELDPGTASAVVVHLLEHLPSYSFLESEKIGVGSRIRLVYSLLKLIDSAAWGKSKTSRRDNTDKNVLEIADWVFGEGAHTNAGVLRVLGTPSRGPLGLFDLLLFRLYCSPDRSSSLFNLSRALSLHANPSAQTSGVVSELAREGMREISQAVFQMFKTQYITPGRNIFEEIDALSLDDFAGKCGDFVRSRVASGAVGQDEVDHLIAAEKTHVTAFVVYQLANSLISNGVGCGLYDEVGKADRKSIANQMNEYLFACCFSPETGQGNAERLLDYLLMNLSLSLGHDAGYTASVDEFTKVLDKQRLTEYWRRHRVEILALDLPAKKKSIRTANYMATYADDLKAVFLALDALVEEATVLQTD